MKPFARLFLSLARALRINSICQGLVLVMVFLALGGSQARAEVVAQAQINQDSHTTFTFSVTSDSDPRYGASYEVLYYNAEGEQLPGSNSIAVYGHQKVTFGPLYPVAQESRNVALIVVNRVQLSIYNVIITPSIEEVDPEKNQAGTSPDGAMGLGASGSAVGSLAGMTTDNPECYQYYRIFLDHNEKLVLNGTTQSETTNLGASFFVDIVRAEDGAGTDITNKSPYGTVSFDGGYTNAGNPAAFYLRFHCESWKVIKYKFHCDTFQPTESGEPCEDCTTAWRNRNNLSGPKSSLPVVLSNGREESSFAPDLQVNNSVGDPVSWRREWSETSALRLAASPGFSPGWTHNYDTWLNSDGH